MLAPLPDPTARRRARVPHARLAALTLLALAALSACDEPTRPNATRRAPRVATGPRRNVATYALGGVTTTVLGSLGGNGAIVTGVGPNGEVVGYEEIGSTRHAWYWAPGQSALVDIAPGLSYAEPAGVLPNGDVVLTAQTASFGNRDVLRWTPPNGPLAPMPTFGFQFSFAEAVSRTGDVAGTSFVLGGNTHATRYPAAGGIEDIHDPALGANSFGRKIGPGGDIVGEVVDNARSLFRWTVTGHRMEILQPLDPADYLEVTAVGPNGEAAGMEWSAVDGFPTAVRWPAGAGGAVQDIGSAIAPRSTVAAIGPAGDIIGSAEFVPGYRRSFRWTPSGGAQDIGGPAAPYSINAAGVGPNGEVAGVLSRENGTVQGFVVTSAFGFRNLGIPPGYTMSVADFVTSAGDAVGIVVTPAGLTEAAVWRVTSANGFPLAGASTSTPAPVEGSAVSFTGTAWDPDGDPLTYAWDFGDGQTSTALSPTHVYADNGSYTATLTVTDLSGAPATASVSVTVSNVAPTVHAGQDRFVYTGRTISLASEFSDPGVADHQWTVVTDWGDAAGGTAVLTSSQGALPRSHAYASPGTYTVTFEVTDKDGGATIDQAVITVADVPAKSATIGIDILPGVNPNALTFAQLASVRVAVLSSRTPTGAVAIDATLMTAPGSPPVALGVATGMVYPQSVTRRDVDGDGITDLELDFDLRDLYPGGLTAPVSPTLTLQGSIRGRVYKGTGQLRITP